MKKSPRKNRSRFEHSEIEVTRFVLNTLILNLMKTPFLLNDIFIIFDRFKKIYIHPVYKQLNCEQSLKYRIDSISEISGYFGKIEPYFFNNSNSDCERKNPINSHMNHVTSDSKSNAKKYSK